MLVGAGFLNLLHSVFHFIQIIQSFLLVKVYTFGPHLPKNQDVLHDIIHSPYLAVLWLIIGIYLFYLGIKDFKNIKW